MCELKGGVNTYPDNIKSFSALLSHLSITFRAHNFKYAERLLQMKTNKSFFQKLFIQFIQKCNYTKISHKNSVIEEFIKHIYQHTGILYERHNRHDMCNMSGLRKKTG